MANQQHFEPNYSTLEVANHNNTYHYDGSTAPEVAPGFEAASHKIYYDPSDAPEYNSRIATPATLGAVPAGPPPPAAKPTTFCGLSRRTFWIIIIVAVLVIGGLAGGLGGGLAARNQAASAVATPTAQPTTTPNGSGNNTNTNSTGPTTGALENSQLAAFNWTDSSNAKRRAIFYQNNGSLFFNQYHPDNSSWSDFNLSAAFERETPANALKVKPGTPLAAAAVSLDDATFLEATEGRNPGFSAALYYIDTDNHLRELFSNHEDLLSWSQGKLKDAALVAANNSHLSAMAYYCPNTDNCTNEFITIYQDTSQNINLAYGPDWESPRQVASGYPGASVAVIPLASSEGKNITDISEMRIFYYTNTAFNFYYYNYRGFMIGPSAITGQNIVDNKLPQIIASPCDLHGHIIAASMDGSGEFTASFYDYNTTANDGWQMNQRMRFQNEDGSYTNDRPGVGLTSIAMDNDGTMYGISEDGTSVISYSWSSEASVRYDFIWKEKIVVG